MVELRVDRSQTLDYDHINYKEYTVNPEIFGVKIFSDNSKNPKIKNTKIPCLEIIGVFNFQTDARIRKLFYLKICSTKIFEHENFQIYGISCVLLFPSSL